MLGIQWNPNSKLLDPWWVVLPVLAGSGLFWLGLLVICVFSGIGDRNK